MLAILSFFQFDLEGQLALFCRDEVVTWFFTKHVYYPVIDQPFRNQVALNVESIVKKAELMSCKYERNQVGVLGSMVLIVLTLLIGLKGG